MTRPEAFAERAERPVGKATPMWAARLEPAQRRANERRDARTEAVVGGWLRTHARNLPTLPGR